MLNQVCGLKLANVIQEDVSPGVENPQDPFLVRYREVGADAQLRCLEPSLDALEWGMLIHFSPRAGKPPLCREPNRRSECFVVLIFSKVVCVQCTGGPLLPSKPSEDPALKLSIPDMLSSPRNPRASD